MEPCHKCGFQNEETAEQCANCNYNLSWAAENLPPFRGTADDTKKIGANVRGPNFSEKKPEPVKADKTTPPTKTCPYCAETIKYEAVVCRFCGRDLKRMTSSASRTHYPVQNTPSAPPKESPSGVANIFAIVSSVCCFVGFFIYGLPLGTIAIVCGLVALVMGQKSGLAGVIGGIINIALVAVALLSLSGR